MGKVTVQVDGKEVTREEIMEQQVRRAYHILRRVKEKLGPEKLYALFEDDCREEDERYLAAVKRSRPGRFQKAEVHVFAEGCTFADWRAAYGDAGVDSHPEHLIARPIQGDYNNFEVMEPLGETDRVFRFWMHREVDLDTFPFQPDPDSTVVLRTMMTTMDGDYLGLYAFHQFKEREDGLDAKLCIVFPEGVDSAIVEGQRRHLTIEFYNWMSAAAAVAAERSRQSGSGS